MSIAGVRVYLHGAGTFAEVRGVYRDDGGPWYQGTLSPIFSGGVLTPEYDTGRLETHQYPDQEPIFASVAPDPTYGQTTTWYQRWNVDAHQYYQERAWYGTPGNQPPGYNTPQIPIFDEVLSLRNMFDPQSDYHQVAFDVITGDVVIDAPNLWAIDVYILSIDPSIDRWYKSPDVGKYGWVTPLYNYPDRLYGEMKWINFPQTRIFLQPR